MAFNNRNMNSGPNFSNVGQRRPMPQSMSPFRPHFNQSQPTPENKFNLRPPQQKFRPMQQNQRFGFNNQQIKQELNFVGPDKESPQQRRPQINQTHQQNPTFRRNSPFTQGPVFSQGSPFTQNSSFNPNPPFRQDSPYPQNSAFTSNGDDHNETSPKRVWALRKTQKLNKKDKLRRKNVQLNKFLQPKNAIMILNELVKQPQIVIEEIENPVDENQYKAVLTLNGVHEGLGSTKNQAKNNAAENAIKYLFKNKKFPLNESGSWQEAMEVNEDKNDIPIPWQQVTSLALHKLFTSWGAENSNTEKKLLDHKPARKMPDNPELMQPLMLLNQMVPHAEFKEVGKVESPNNAEYAFKCIVDGQEYVGKGKNKKLAKKNAGYLACHKVLNINYDKEVWPGPSSEQTD